MSHSTRLSKIIITKLISSEHIYITSKVLLYFALLTLTMPNFLNGIIRRPFLPLSIIIFEGYQDENLKMVSQQYRAWSDCTAVQAGLALYWWQRLIIFGVGRIRVNTVTCIRQSQPLSSTYEICIIENKLYKAFIYIIQFLHE